MRRSRLWKEKTELAVSLKMLKTRQTIIAHLCVAACILDMTDRVLSHDLPWPDEFTLRMIRAHYLRRMRRVLALMPAWMSAVSEPMVWPAIGFTQN